MKKSFAVYTIVSPDQIDESFTNGGKGILEERRIWKKVSDQKNIRGTPLLLGNASYVNGVEWVGEIERIEIHDGRTRCFFSNLRRLSKKIPLNKLLKESNNEPLSADYIRPYVPCLLGGATKADVLNTLRTEDKERGLATQHYVQYHNSDTQGGPPDHVKGNFSIYTSKNINNLGGKRIWLISGQGKSPKKFFLEYVFTVKQTKNGNPNVAIGNEGISFNPPLLLNDLSWFESFKKTQFFSLGLYRIDGQIQNELTNLAQAYEPASSLDHLAQLTADQYLDAMNELGASFTEAQIEMLVGHANTPNQSISTQKLASLAGFTNFSAANLQYGKLGRKFSDFFGVGDLDNQIQALATGAHEKDNEGHFQWVMRSPLREALQRKWPDQILDSYSLQATGNDQFADEQGHLLPTERAAITQARIGQGAYRRKLLELWDGQCALTGCSVEEVLRASHAKPWKISSNQERLDPYNGLLLAAHVDALFDAGLIGFSDSGKLLLSNQITPEQLHTLGIETSQTLRFVKDQHHKYLAEHRKQHKLK